MGLTRVALSRPIFIFMLMLAAVFLGRQSYMGMRKEQNPDVSFGVITISTVYPGAGPEEINTLISRKIEEAVAGVSGIREVTSTSQEGFSTVVANFEVGTDMDEALNDTRAKVDAIVGQLPTAVEKPTVSKLDTGSSPVMTLALSSPTMDNQQLRDLTDDKIKDRFARISGVASVNVSGGDVRELQVQVKKDKLLAYGIGITTLQRAIQTATLNIPSGRFVSGGKEYSVRVLGEFNTPDDLANMVIEVQNPNNPQAKGSIIRLKDVATIVDATVERRSYSRLNGSDSVVLTIQKAREGNAVEIAKAAGPIREAIQKEYGIESVVTLNEATNIEESLFDLNFALFFGIFLVASIVFLFLHDMRGTIIVAIAIPVCIMATFIVMNLLGFTINNLSMLALSLAIGVLVDDAIVVHENIYRHLRMGEDPRDAAINGRSEIGLAAIAITLADVVVFLPIGFMGGILGQFFKPLGIGFAVTVLLSLFVSFTVTPMLASRWYRAGEDLEHPKGRFGQWFERNFERFAHGYQRMLSWALAHRWFVFILGNLALVAIINVIAGSFAPNAGAAIKNGMGLTFAAIVIGVIVMVVNIIRMLRRGEFKSKVFLMPVFGLLFGLIFPAAALSGFKWAEWKKEPIFKFAFFPPSDGGRVSVDIQLPPGASLEATQRIVERVEAEVAKHPDTKYVLSSIGSSGGGGGFSASSSGTNLAIVNVTLNDKKAIMDSIAFWKKHDEKLRTRADTAVAADMLEQIGRIPGAQIKVSANAGVGFGAPIQMSFAGDNSELLVSTVSNIVLKLRNNAIPGVINADISSKPGKPELRLIPDRVRLADAGLSVAEVAAALRMLYEGDEQTKFRTGGREYDIRVMMDRQDRNNPDILSQLPVTFNQGTPLFVSELGTVVQGTGVDKIDRRDRAEEVRLTADLLPGFAAGSVQAQIDRWLADEKLVPEGVRIKPLGQADVQARETGYLFGALGIGLVLVFMLLASLYDNLLYPFIIQVAQPQAMVGALLALMITDKTLNIVGFVGIITLVGLVGKNAILLVDYTNTLRMRGKERIQALLEAGPVRLRPIMMTTLALILGVLPVALAVGRGSEFRETIGITIIGGITLSTLLTLFVIPCSYTIFDDLSEGIAKMRGLRGKGDATLFGNGEGSEPEPSTEEPAGKL